VVKHELTGASFRSNVIRPRQHEAWLQGQGDQIYILRLQGFIFFGTANKLFDQVRARLSDPDLPVPRYVVLDFRRVTGLDSSAVSSFTKMKQLAHAVTLVFTDLEPGIQRLLGKSVFEDEQGWRVFPDLDHGMEWCENDLIAAGTTTGPVAPPRTMIEHLESVLPAGADRFLKYLDCREVEAGHILIHQGEPPQGLYFIEQGQVTVRLDLPDGESVRLRRMDPGTIVGELGMYLHRPASASVVAEEPCTFYHLTPEGLQQMEANDPGIATEFHRFMARFLAERLVQTTNTLQALVD
jgi:SulP family sulfate permease